MSKIKMFRVDVEVVATAYIFAESAERAQELAQKEFTNSSEELPEDKPFIDGRPYERIVEEMEDGWDRERVTISPAVTFKCPLGNVEEESL